MYNLFHITSSKLSWLDHLLYFEPVTVWNVTGSSPALPVFLSVLLVFSIILSICPPHRLSTHGGGLNKEIGTRILFFKKKDKTNNCSISYFK